MKNALLAVALTWSVAAWAQKAVEAVQQLPSRRSSDGPAPRVAAAWDDARVGDQATWRFKTFELSGKVKAEVLSVGSTVTVLYEVTSEALKGPLAFRVGIDRSRKVPHGVDREPPTLKAGTFTLEGKELPCEEVEIPDRGGTLSGDGTGCRVPSMPYALLDGWLQAQGRKEWELVLESATRGARGAKPTASEAPMVLTPFSWAYQKENGGESPEVGSYRVYSIRGFVLDAYLRFPMSCNVSECSYVQTQTLGAFVISLLTDVHRERTAEPRRDVQVTDEELKLNGKTIKVRTRRGTHLRGDVPTAFVSSSAQDPLCAELDGLMWRMRVPWLISGSPSDPHSAELISWGTGTPAALPLVPMMARRER
jgi:hypothetical protein